MRSPANTSLPALRFNGRARAAVLILIVWGGLLAGTLLGQQSPSGVPDAAETSSAAETRPKGVSKVSPVEDRNAELVMEAEAGPQVLQLWFGWPRDMAGWVDWSRRASATPGEDQLDVRGRYRLTTSPHPRGILLTQKEMPFEVIHDPSGFWQALARVGSHLETSFVITKQGEMVQLLGVEDLQAAITSALAELGSEALPPDLSGMIQEMVSEEALLHAARQNWAPAVGFWRGKELEEGAAHFDEAEAPSVIDHSSSFPLHMELVWTGNEPCVRGDVERRCAVLEMTGTHETVAIVDALRSMAERVSGQTAGPEELAQLDAMAQGLESTLSWKLVTEPEGLIPHRLEVRAFFKMSLPTGGGGQLVERVETSTWTYHYDSVDTL